MKDADLLEIFDEAVKFYGEESQKLSFLPKQRFNRAIFPTIGQYDWLLGTLLYCLIRYIKPVRVIEVSTSSGYSSVFSATALKDNGFGKLFTFEFSKERAVAAQKNFKRFGVDEFVKLYVGDARENIGKLVEIRKKDKSKEILFIDSEHTKELAEFLMKEMLRYSAAGSLLHVHDILPPFARVKYRPASGISDPKFRNKAHLYWLLKKIAPFLVQKDLRSFVKPVNYDATDETTEAVFVHALSKKIPPKSQVYVHDMINRYKSLNPEMFFNASVWRCDAKGNPMEWNESWWVKAEDLKKVV